MTAVENRGSLLRTWERLAATFGIPAKPEFVFGRENIPLNPPYIVAANHRGWAEIFALWEIWPEWIHWMSRDLNFKIPILKDFCRQAGMFPVTRGTVDRNALSTAQEILNSGKVLGMMIEGTRGRGETLTKLNLPRRGTAHIALTAKVPVVPVAVVGSENYAPLIDVEPWRFPFEIVRLLTKTPHPAMRVAIGKPVVEHLHNHINSTDLTNLIFQQLGQLIEHLEL